MAKTFIVVITLSELFQTPSRRLSPAAAHLVGMTTVLVLICLSFLLAYGLLRVLESRICKHVAAEPPLVHARIPIFGHVLGLLRYGVSYYRMLRFVRPRGKKERKKEFLKSPVLRGRV